MRLWLINIVWIWSQGSLADNCPSVRLIVRRCQAEHPVSQNGVGQGEFPKPSYLGS